ncbi:MAG TPA: type II 3-dehydroquinate dehydratase [Bacteroidales bacterium]|nr:type II 3-dehydroquinate dehydratase [Bacteroidales bacterium]
MKIQIINGSNLNLLGTREPGVYGSRSFENYLEHLRSVLPQVTFTYYQSNIEGELVNMIQAAGKDSDAIIINPGGYSHTSVAVADAIASVSPPVIEVHISNLLSREEFRHTSITGRYCRGTIMGLGLDGYRLAAEHIMLMMEKEKK